MKLKINSILKAVRSEEWLAVILFLVIVAINIFVYHEAVTPLEAWRLMYRYFTFGEPFFGLFFIVIYLLVCFRIYQVLVKIRSDLIIKNHRPQKTVLINLTKQSLNLLRAIVPLVLTALPKYQLLTHLSYQFRFSGQDLILAAADRSLFGVLPFVYLANHFNADWFVNKVYYFYFSLAIVISVLLAFLLLTKKEKLLRLAITAFMISSVLAFPLFYAAPCQDPSHYFIANNRQQLIPPEIVKEMAGYQPSTLTKALVAKISRAETIVERDNAVPISCFPSMHAVWAIIVVYFLAKVRRATLWASIPWLLLTLTGGLYFAQHYLIDYVVAVPVAILSIICAHWLIRLGD